MVKLVDVAREAQVSVATVSRALNNNEAVDPVLADRVRAAARSSGTGPTTLLATCAGSARACGC